MGAFRGQHETIELGSGEQVHMHNFMSYRGPPNVHHLLHFVNVIKNTTTTTHVLNAKH